MISFELMPGKNDIAVLRRKASFNTPVVGYEAQEYSANNACMLEKDGTITLFSGFVWDFGSGAIDTPDMIEPSLVHDAFCHLTDEGMIPWKCRKTADRLLYTMLRERGCNWFRATYIYLAVRAYSKVRRWTA